MIPKEPDMKGAFDNVYDTLEDLLAMTEANPKCYEDSEAWARLIDNANEVLNFYRKLRKEP